MSHSISHPKTVLSRVLSWTLVCALALGASGCMFGREFRAAAGPNLQSGVQSILTGLVNGFFAAIEPEPENDG